MTAIPASTTTGRSQPAPAGPMMTRAGLTSAGWRDGCGSRSSRGEGSAGIVSPASGHAQCPRHVQWLARP